MARIIEINEGSAIVDIGNVRKEIELGLLEKEVKIDEWVLIHTGFAISKVDQKKAQEIIDAYKEMDEPMPL